MTLPADHKKRHDHKALQSGHHFVRLAQWGLISRYATWYSLNGLKWYIFLFISTVVGGIVLAFELPLTVQQMTLAGLLIAVIGIGATFWGVAKGLESLFAGETLQRKVVMYPGKYLVKNKKIIATAVNIGDPLLIREVELMVGWIQKNNSFLQIFDTKLSMIIEYLGKTPIITGCEYMDKGAVWRFDDEHIRKALIHTENFFKKGLDDYRKDPSVIKPQVYLAIFDRFREERIPRTANKGAQAQSIEGLVSICSLGDYDSLLKEAQDGKEFSIGTEATFEMYGDSKEGFVPSRFIRYAPPAYASREDLVLEQMRDLKAILGKLCAIENDLAKKKK